MKTCSCPVPCEFSIFEPSFSYATLSNHIVTKLLTSKDRLDIMAKLLQASETTTRMDKTKLENFKALVSALIEVFDKIKSLAGTIAMRIAHQLQAIEQAYNETESAYIEKERLYRFQQYAVENNFLRGSEEMEAINFANIVVSYTEFAMLNTRRIRRLAAMTGTDVRGRMDLYETIMDALKVRQDVTGLSKGNLTVLYNAFVNGTRIFNYKFQNISLTHNDYITPKPLLSYSMRHNSNVREFWPKMFDGLDLMHNSLNMFINEATEAFLNLTVNETRLTYAFEQYILSCRQFIFSKIIVYRQGLALPASVLKEKYDNFEKLWTEIKAFVNKIRDNLIFLNLNLNKLEKRVSPAFTKLIDKAIQYAATRNESLLTFTDEFLSDRAQMILSFIIDLFEDVDQKGFVIFNAWTSMMRPVEDFWTAILEDEDMSEYYEFTNNTRFLQNLTDVLNRRISQYSSARSNSDVTIGIQAEDLEFVQAFCGLTDYLRSFENSIKIDSVFVGYVWPD